MENRVSKSAKTDENGVKDEVETGETDEVQTKITDGWAECSVDFDFHSQNEAFAKNAEAVFGWSCA